MSSSSKVAKLHVCGNDFVFIAGDLPGPVHFNAVLSAQRFCDRRRGIGADQLVFVGSRQGGEVSLSVFNPDGSEAPLCANATLAAATFMADMEGWSDGSVTFVTPSGPREVVREKDGWCSVCLGRPQFIDATQPVEVWLDRQLAQLYTVDSGTRHAIYFVDGVVAYPVASAGPRLEWHPALTPPTNVMFVEELDVGVLRMRPWERGNTGETLACGSGAVASVFAQNHRRGGLTPKHAEVHCPGGTLQVHDENGMYYLIAKPTRVCKIEIAEPERD
jgi:diaminopimelate epimerase